MKKLLTLSVLAATLASTAVFAQAQMDPSNGMGGNGGMDKPSMGKPGMGKPGMGNPSDQNGAPVLLISKKASQPTMKGFQIAQTLVDALSGQGNVAKRANLSFDDKGAPEKAEIVVAKKVTADDVDAIQEAALASIRLANDELGWTGIIANPGKGDEIVKIHAISHIDGDDSVVAIVAKLTDGGKKILIVKAPADKATADKLLKAKEAADLGPVEGKGKGKGKGRG